MTFNFLAVSAPKNAFKAFSLSERFFLFVLLLVLCLRGRLRFFFLPPCRPFHLLLVIPNLSIALPRFIRSYPRSAVPPTFIFLTEYFLNFFFRKNSQYWILIELKLSFFNQQKWEIHAAFQLDDVYHSLSLPHLFILLSPPPSRNILPFTLFFSFHQLYQELLNQIGFEWIVKVFI